MALVHQPYEISFTAETTIYENEVQCTLSENDFNYTQNPTAASRQRATTAATAIIYVSQVLTGFNYIEVYAVDPTHGQIYLGGYTQAAVDTTTDILAANIATAINQNTYGYVVTSNGNQVIVTAPPGAGLSMNGMQLIVNGFVLRVFNNTFNNTFN